MYSGSNDLTIRSWDVKTGECLKQFTGHTPFLCGLALSHKKNILYSTSNADKTIRIWDVKTGECLKQFTRDTIGVSKLGLSPNGDTLYSDSKDKTISSWDVNTGECLKVEEDRSGRWDELVNSNEEQNQDHPYQYGYFARIDIRQFTKKKNSRREEGICLWSSGPWELTAEGCLFPRKLFLLQ